MQNRETWLHPHIDKNNQITSDWHEDLAYKISWMMFSVIPEDLCHAWQKTLMMLVFRTIYLLLIEWKETRDADPSISGLKVRMSADLNLIILLQIM